MKTLVKNKSGSSMLYAIVFFLFMAVLAMNLLNAVNANLLDTKREVENAQTVLYLQSLYNIVDEMVETGKFKTAIVGNNPIQAETTVLDANNEPIKIKLLFERKSSYLMVKVQMEYEETWYEIVSRYQKSVSTSSDTYQRKTCEGLRELTDGP